jgi:uncharacterized zinc-type alcohol dehydrogenase-like protein
MPKIQALAASEARAKLAPFSYDPGPLLPEQVEIDVQYCGICHSDLSMLNNEWGFTAYPFVPGHEAIGVISAPAKAPKASRPAMLWGSAGTPEAVCIAASA